MARNMTDGNAGAVPAIIQPLRLLGEGDFFVPSGEIPGDVNLRISSLMG